MFGFDLSECLIIGVAIVVFIKPEDFPVLVRKIGQWYGQWTRAYESVKHDLTAIRHTETFEKGDPPHDRND